MYIKGKLAKAVLMSMLAMGVFGSVVEAAALYEINSSTVGPYISDGGAINTSSDLLYANLTNSNETVSVAAPLTVNHAYDGASNYLVYVNGDKTLTVQGSDVNINVDKAASYTGSDSLNYIIANSAGLVSDVKLNIGAKNVWMPITNSGTLSFNRDVNLIVEGNFFGVFNYDGGVVDFNSNVAVKRIGDSWGYGLLENRGIMNFNGNGTTTIVEEDGATVDNRGTMNFSCANTSISGSLSNSDTGVIYFNGPVSITRFGSYNAIDNSGTITSADNSSVVIDGPVRNFSSGTMTLNGSTTIIYVNSVNDDAISNFGSMLITGAGSKITSIGGPAILNTGNLKITDDVRVQIQGDINVTGAANTDITLQSTDLQESSYIDGKILGTDNNFKLEIKAGGKWYADKQDTTAVNGVILNGGEILLTPMIGNVGFSPSDFKTLNLHSFTANNGYIELKTDLENNIGDKLHIENANINNLNVGIQDKNGANPSINGNVRIMEVADGPSTPSGVINFVGSHYTGDGFIATPIVIEGQEGDFKTYNFTGWNYIGGPEPMPGPDPIPGPDPMPGPEPMPGPTPTPGPSPEPPAAESEKAPARDEASINAADMNTTIKRMNDIRTDPAEVGVWIRGEKGKNKIRNYSYDYNLMSGGYDWHIDNDARSLFYGIGFTYSTNKCNDGVVGDSKSTGYNLYGSWLGKKHNDYIDVVLKYGKLKKEYSGIDHNNMAVSGEYDKNLFVISTKYGRRFYKDSGLYFEPQVGYSYGRVGSADYDHKQPGVAPIKIHADATNSHIVSFDLQVGKNIKGTELYNKIGYVYDLNGKIELATDSGLVVTDDMGGGYVRWTIGASRKVGKNNSFYCDIEKDFGSKVKKPYAVSLGYRHTF